MDFNKKFMIVSNLANTLTKAGGLITFPPSNIKSIRELSKNPNFNFCIASGKGAFFGIDIAVSKLGLAQDIYTVLSNGANISVWNINNKNKFEVLELNSIENPKRITSLLDGWMETEPYIETINGKTVKICLYMTKDYKANPKYQELMKYINNEKTIQSYNFGYDMDIMNIASNKYNGIKKVQEILNIENDQVAVIGYGINDMIMLDAFKNSFLVANSNAKDKKPKHTVLLNSTNEDGYFPEVLAKLNYSF